MRLRGSRSRGLQGLSFRRRRRRAAGPLVILVLAGSVAGAGLAVTEEIVPVPGVSAPPGDRALAGDTAEDAPSLDVSRLVDALPEPPPAQAGVRAARRYLDRRQGEASFAARAPGRPPVGYRPNESYAAASLSKAMLLVATLRRYASAGRPLDSRIRALLEPMITVSDNNAADAVDSALDDGELESLAEDAGMTSFSPAYWPDIALTAADEARFFLRLERLIPDEHRAYARDLLSSIAPEQTWGIPDAAGPDRRSFFKGGWRAEGGGWRVNQAARLERPGARPIAVAVLTRGNPSYEYGQKTIEGVAERLLRFGY